jgi:hypothetical protein
VLLSTPENSNYTAARLEVNLEPAPQATELRGIELLERKAPAMVGYINTDWVMVSSTLCGIEPP